MDGKLGLANKEIPLAFMAPTATTIPEDTPAETNAKTKHYSCVFGDGTGIRAGCDCHYDITSNNAGWFDAKLKTTDNFTAFSEIQIPDCCYDPTLFNKAAGLMRQILDYDSCHGFSTVNYFIWLMIQLKPADVPYIPILILKCLTIRLGLSLGNWGMLNPG